MPLKAFKKSSRYAKRDYSVTPTAWWTQSDVWDEKYDRKYFVNENFNIDEQNFTQVSLILVSDY